jgi:hypothetical protein
MLPNHGESYGNHNIDTLLAISMLTFAVITQVTSYELLARKVVSDR